MGRFGQNRLVVGMAAIAAIAAIGAWQWSWLAASGVTPLLLSIAPCAVMCGFGLCMSHMGGRSCGAVQNGPVALPTSESLPADKEK